MSIKVTSYTKEAILGLRLGAKEGSIETAISVVSRTKLLSNYTKGYQTGDMKSSWHWKSKEKTSAHSTGEDIYSSPSSTEIIVGTTIPYATYLEFGTRNMDAQPTLRPAVDMETNGATAANAMAKAQRQSVKREVK